MFAYVHMLGMTSLAATSILESNISQGSSASQHSGSDLCITMATSLAYPHKLLALTHDSYSYFHFAIY